MTFLYLATFLATHPEWWRFALGAVVATATLTYALPLTSLEDR